MSYGPPRSGAGSSHWGGTGWDHPTGGGDRDDDYNTATYGPPTTSYYSTTAGPSHNTGSYNDPTYYPSSQDQADIDEAVRENHAIATNYYSMHGRHVATETESTELGVDGNPMLPADVDRYTTWGLNRDSSPASSPGHEDDPAGEDVVDIATRRQDRWANEELDRHTEPLAWSAHEAIRKRERRPRPPRKREAERATREEEAIRQAMERSRARQGNEALAGMGIYQGQGSGPSGYQLDDPNLPPDQQPYQQPHQQPYEEPHQGSYDDQYDDAYQQQQHYHRRQYR
ncbi:hypothetical protein PG984_010392 [Apiospora sp. TS-2023a]